MHKIVVLGEVGFTKVGDIVKVCCGPGKICEATLVDSGDGDGGLDTVVLDDGVQDFDCTGRPLWIDVEVRINSGGYEGKFGRVVKITEKCVFVSFPNISGEFRILKTNVSSLHKHEYE